MNFQSFFTLEEDALEGLCISVKPTRYLEKLHPHKAMLELKTYMEALHERLFRIEGKVLCQSMDDTNSEKKVRGILFELETCEEYLCYLREHFSTVH